MKKIVLIILAVFILIQFVRPEKNNSQNETNSIEIVMEVPTEVQQILKTSCNDCHSNNTNYPWYSEIAPVSWYLTSHVNEGKEHLNFSEWALYNENQRNHIIEDLLEELEEKKMPLKSYLIVHENAKMTAEQYKILINWVKTIK